MSEHDINNANALDEDLQTHQVENANEQAEVLQTEQHQASEPANDADAQEPPYLDQNDELDALLNEATTTKAEYADQERQHSVPVSQMSQEEAAKYAVKGIAMIVQWAGNHAGEKLQLSQMQLGLFATLATPVVIKHGATVQNYISSMAEGVDSDSYMPEMLAAGGAAGLGATLYMQNRKIKRQKAGSDGN